MVRRLRNHKRKSTLEQSAIKQLGSDRACTGFTFARGHKTVFMLNSVEHEICHMLINLKLLIATNSFLLNIAGHENFSGNRYENINYCWHYCIY